MKKILLLLSAAALWNCTDYAADWDEKYENTFSNTENNTPAQTPEGTPTQTPSYSVCEEGKTTSLVEGNCTTDFVCQNDSWIPTSYNCNEATQELVCEEGSTTNLETGGCTTNFICSNNTWIPAGEPICTTTPTESSSSGDVDLLVDSRDNQTYKTTKIGNQVWMAQNLNYNTSNSYCYGGSASNCTKYGRLYTWTAAVGKTEKNCGFAVKCTLPSRVQGACPNGWHLPSQAEMNVLFSSIGGASMANRKLKSTSGWKNNKNGADEFGFSAYPAGRRRTNGTSENQGVSADFWTSTQDNSGTTAYSMHLFETASAEILKEWPKGTAFSVRCVKN